MQEILKNIQIIPIDKTLCSEETIRTHAKKLANVMEHDGTHRDPIVVANVGEMYIALDGMHRVEALKVMGCRDLTAYIVDYDSKEIILESWDALISGCMNMLMMTRDEFKDSGFELIQIEQDAREAVLNRKCILSILDKYGKAHILTSRNENSNLSLETIINTLIQFEKRLDNEGASIQYVPNTESDHLFIESNNEFQIIRPRFTKKEVVRRTLTRQLFPRKTTRHVIHERPLRVGVALSLLKNDLDLGAKNKLLQAELQWRHKHGRIRFYQESIILLDE